MAVSGNGRQVVDVPKDMEFWATRFAPVVTMARGGTTTLTPRLVGDVEVVYEEREAANVSKRYFDFDAGEMRTHADA